MKLLIILIFSITSLSGYSQKEKEIHGALKKLPKAQQEELAQILLLRAEMEHADSKLTPEITVTGLEGFKFKTQNPMVLEDDASEIWKKFRDPQFEKISQALHPLYSSSTSPIEYQNYNSSKYVFRHYPLGSEFSIKTFIHVGSGWMFVLTDQTGKDMVVEDEHVLDRMIDGDGSSYSTGLNMMYLYWNSNGKSNQTVKAQCWQLSGVTRFIEAIKQGNPRAFPLFKDRTIPSPEPKTKGDWINYFLKGTIGKTAKFSNEREENHVTVFDIHADTDVLMFLVYAHFIEPSVSSKEYSEITHNLRFQDQDGKRLLANTLHEKRKRHK